MDSAGARPTPPTRTSDHWSAEQKRGPKRKAPIVEEEPEKEHRELNEAEDDALKKAHYDRPGCVEGGPSDGPFKTGPPRALCGPSVSGTQVTYFRSRMGPRAWEGGSGGSVDGW